MVLPISEGYALKYFLLYALTCTLVGIALLFIIREVVPFAIDKPTDQSVADSTEPVAGPTEQSAARPTGEPVPRQTTDQSAVQPADPLVVRSTGQPVDGPAREPMVGPTGEPVARPTDQSVVGPSGEPVVRKGGRLGSPAQ
ncbi:MULTISPECIES: hypothetical protein [Rhizobium]|uniref:hypothetical protein n=1 Tax=Rhizobium TaxID=379 RepID=UPI001FE8E69F|nr:MULTISPECIES: hypothetical protein [Rhizobium]